jgi:dienelactone hydrolase
MKKLFTILSILSSFCLNAQIFQTGTLTLTFNDPLRSGGFGSGGGPGRQIQTEIYYPAVTAGSNVAVASGTFPVVVIGHGFVMTWDSYDNIYSELSKRGYIVALPRTEGSASPNHSDFGKDLAQVAGKILDLNTTNTITSIFVGKINGKAAIGGHSMGGGSSFLGASSNNTLTSLFNFAAAQTNPRSSQAAKTVTVPTLIIGGRLDCVASYTTNQSLMWDSLASANKFALNLKNLTHCDFSNGSSATCNFGQTTSGCGSTVSNTLALRMYMNFLNPFLDATLKGNCLEATRFMDSVNNSTVIFSKKLLGSIACAPTSISNHKFNKVSIFPNPTKDQFILATDRFLDKVNLTLYNLNGEVILNQFHESSVDAVVSLQGFPPGVYVLKVNSGQTQEILKVIKSVN